MARGRTSSAIRPIQILWRRSSETVLPASSRRWRRNCVGRRSPNASPCNNCRIFSSWDMDNRLMSISLRDVYLSHSEGLTNMSFTSLVQSESKYDSTTVNLISSSVILCILNCRSSCANHRSGSSGRNGAIRNCTGLSAMLHKFLSNDVNFSLEI